MISIVRLKKLLDLQKQRKEKRSLYMIFFSCSIHVKISKSHYSWHVHNNLFPDLMAVLSKIWGL